MFPRIHLQDWNSDTCYGPYTKGVTPRPPHGVEWNHQPGIVEIGYMKPLNGKSLSLWQESGPMGWCASNWTHHPVDELWSLEVGNRLLTRADIESLDFRNSPFEQRWNYRETQLQRGFSNWSFIDQISIDYDFSDLDDLAHEEELLWGKDYSAFIPFKDPHPEGYKGVLGRFHGWMTYKAYSLLVQDKFDSKHILELGWDV